MRIVATSVAALAATLVPRGAAAAGEDRDLDLIPSGVIEDAAPARPLPPSPVEKSSEAAPTLHGKFFLEDAFTAWSAPMDIPVPYPSAVADWQNRSSLDASFQWRPWRPLAITLSDRLNVIEQSDASFASAQTVRNDFREGYVTWEPAANAYLEAGRINVRNGVALGFNPNDFFKTRTLVGQASLDPSVLRQNRLGTLMARAQAIWRGGSAAVAFAPRVADPSPVVAATPVGVDPRFDATNAAYRLLCAVNVDALDLGPQLLGYFELHRSKLGLNLTRPIGDAVVAYAEWAGGPETNLITRAVEYGRTTGTLPPGAPVVPTTEPSTQFRNDVAAGFSWTIATTVTLNLEYHFHQAGFTRSDWHSWFAVGSAANASRALTGELWYLRGYANDQQEPVPAQQAFVRLSWPKALVSDLEVTAFALADLLDGSALAQLSASYYLSGAWTASAYVSSNVGGGRSERGSFPQRVNTIVQLTRYL